MSLHSAEDETMLKLIFRALHGKHTETLTYVSKYINDEKKAGGGTGLGHLQILQNLKIKCCLCMLDL